MLSSTLVSFFRPHTNIVGKIKYTSLFLQHRITSDTPLHHCQHKFNLLQNKVTPFQCSRSRNHDPIHGDIDTAVQKRLPDGHL